MNSPIDRGDGSDPRFYVDYLSTVPLVKAVVLYFNITYYRFRLSAGQTAEYQEMAQNNR